MALVQVSDSLYVESSKVLAILIEHKTNWILHFYIDRHEGLDFYHAPYENTEEAVKKLAGEIMAKINAANAERK